MFVYNAAIRNEPKTVVYRDTTVRFIVTLTLMGESVHVYGQGVYRKYLYLPFNFTVNLNCF